MAIKKYFDEKLQREVFRVRIVRKSTIKPGVSVVKREYGITSLSEAERIEKKLNFLAERELVTEEQKSCLWEQLVEDWTLATMKGDVFARHLSKGTLEEYASVLQKYTSDWNKLHAEEIDKARAWMLLDRIDREVSISRRKRLRSAIDAVFSWGILSGRIKGQIPTTGFKTTRREEEKLPEILNLEEIKTLLSYAKKINHHWYPVWAMALFTGMRSGELYALEWTAIDFENKMIYVHRNWTSKTSFGATKGRYWRAVPIGEQLLRFLKELKVRSSTEKFVLPRFQCWADGRQAEILREFCVGAGIPSVKFHTLRACFATQLIKDGVAPAVVMKIAGWKDLKTMQRYIRLAGIEVNGATEGLKLLDESEAMGRVINLFAVPQQ